MHADEISKLINEISASKQKGEFSKYINNIRFPHYKNIDNSTQITFDFPLSVFVGKNGSGKSSILHALYGCPQGLSPRPFWFSTDIDPIKDNATDSNDNLAQSYVYEYFDDSLKEKNGTVFKKRSSRPGTKSRRKDPEYWETSKPAAKYGLKTNMKRYPPLVEDVIYIDFRSELSAYDKFFYFGNIDNLKSRSKQDYIRKFPSKSLKKVFDEDGKKILYKKGKPQNDYTIWLHQNEVKCIGKILGNNYKGIRMVHNRFFSRTWGYTVLLIRDSLKYTEAQAGSGEYAVVMLVHKLLTLDNSEKKLVILDEPETSLFPGAQSRLIEFILNFIKNTHNQVMISSHSTELIRNLPDIAIKKVTYDPNDFKTKVQNKCSPSVAFQELESYAEKSTIFLEDEASRIIIENCLNEDQHKIFNLNICSGADPMNRTYIYASAMVNNKKNFYILDGDQLTPDLESFFDLTPNELNPFISDFKNRQKILNEICTNLQFGNSKPRSEEKASIKYDIRKDNKLREEQMKYLTYYYSHVFFLPKKIINEKFPTFGTPETIVLSSYFEGILTLLNEPQIKWSSINNNNDIKNEFRKVIKERTGSDSNSEKYNSFISELCIQSKKDKNNCNYKEIQDIINKIEKSS